MIQGSSIKYKGQNFINLLKMGFLAYICSAFLTVPAAMPFLLAFVSVFIIKKLLSSHNGRNF
jgi:hypothetical protein